MKAIDSHEIRTEIRKDNHLVYLAEQDASATGKTALLSEDRLFRLASHFGPTLWPHVVSLETTCHEILSSIKKKVQKYFLPTSQECWKD